MNIQSILALPAREIHKQVLEKKISILEITEYYLNNIKDHQSLNAYVQVFGAEAKARSIDLDKKIQSGEKVGQLAGIVVAIKDNICYEGHQVTAASKILKGFTSLFSATAVQRLLDEDAIIIGRLNCDEFGMGSSNENSAYGPVLNPLDPTRVPGGSSGGASAAVAANLCSFALGSETGGSVRQPAAYCGLYGLKPTYGRVSRYGLIAYASSFDQIAPIARHADDLALALSIISGPDEYDATALTTDAFDFSDQQPDKKIKIAVLQQTFDQLVPEIKSLLEAKLSEVKNHGHEINYLDFPYIDYLIPTYYTLVTAEASTNLSRFDGVRYGHRSKEAQSYHDVLTKSRTEGFGEEVKRRIMLGTFVLSSGYYDAYYTKAQKVRRLLSDYMDQLFAEYDLVVLPTCPSTAFKLGDKDRSPVDMYLEDIFTVLASLTGIPAISIPAGIHPEDGMPLGIQLMAQKGEEGMLLDATKFFE